jgi:two-component system LytT family response regulator
MITTIIIDDEQGAANSLRLMLDELNTPVNHLGTAHNALEAIKLIGNAKPQLVFLDINMPFYDGFDLLDHFESPEFFVVFVTAHEEYAIKAIKHDAIDYLLKPIDPDELEFCVNKIQQYIDTGKMPAHLKGGMAGLKDTEQIGSDRKLAIPIRDGVVFIRQEDIIRVEGEGSYSVFHTTGSEQYISSRNLKEFEDLLPGQLFFRIHKSHLINIRRVRKYLKTDGHYVEMEDGSVLEVARRRKDDLLQLINALS